MGHPVLFEQLLAGQLGLGVGRLRLGRHRLEFRHRRVVAVDGGGGSQDDLAGAGGQRGVQHATRALGVELGAFGGLRDGFRHGDHRGQVIDFFGAFGGLPEGAGVEDRPMEEAATDAFEVAGVAAPQVVQHGDLVLVGEPPGEMGADEAGAAGDEDATAHGRATDACMAGSWASMDSTSLNCVRARSRLCVGRLILK